MIFISRLLWLPILLAKIFFDILFQQRYLKNKITPVLNEYRKNNDGSVSETDLIKIVKYYGVFVPLLVGETIAGLRNKKLNARERWSITCQGSMTGLFDDFFDEKQLAPTRINAFIHEPESCTPDDKQEELFLYFYLQSLQNCFDKDTMLQYFDQVNEGQRNSLKQTNDVLPYDEMMQITYYKGGYSTLFYRAYLSPEISKPEQTFLYQFGGLIQLSNDIFDVYKDSRKNVKTIITTSDKLVEVRKVFTDYLNLTLASLSQVPFKKRRIKKEALKQLIFMGRVFVALDQYQKLEQKSGGKFNPMDFERKDLICDMEKPINMLHSIGYYLNHKIPGVNF